jgi:citrate synthase
MSASERTSVAAGLEGVVVAETRLSEVDGQGGHLIIAGYNVEDLAGRVPFESACWLLRHGELPEEAQLHDLRRAFGRARAKAFEAIPRMGDALRMSDGMEALRAALAHLSGNNPDPESESTELIASAAVYVAGWMRHRAGQSPEAPDPSLGHAEDFLRMALGRSAPAPAPAVEALNTYLVAVIDHGMNASTFAARVVASTGSDMVSAIVAAVGALKGPLHGGAPGPVLEMLRSIGSPSRARAWLEAELSAGRRIMGMGHRIYRVRDPRAAVLEQAVERLARAGLATEKLELARAVEREAERLLQERHPDRPLRANVEFYTSVLLDAIGLPSAAFSPTFAVGRVAGWCAHFLEQQAVGRLIRPASRYVGPRPRSLPR